jgi:hypothetical protein
MGVGGGGRGGAAQRKVGVVFGGAMQRLASAGYEEELYLRMRAVT